MTHLEQYELAEQKRVAGLLAKKTADLTHEEASYLAREIRQYMLTDGQPSVIQG